MTDEERKAFESVKDMFGDVTLKDIDEQSITIYGVAMLDVIKVLTIVEKQEKEIEYRKLKRENQRKELAILNAKQVEFNKLVNTVNSYKGQFKKQSKEIEELKEKNEFLNWYFENQKENFVHKDKIKAKIEEVEQWELYNMKIPRLSTLDERLGAKIGIKYVLQSLLEKGK